MLFRSPDRRYSIRWLGLGDRYLAAVLPEDGVMAALLRGGSSAMVLWWPKDSGKATKGLAARWWSRM